MGGATTSSAESDGGMMQSGITKRERGNILLQDDGVNSITVRTEGDNQLVRSSVDATERREHGWR